MFVLVTEYILQPQCNSNRPMPSEEQDKPQQQPLTLYTSTLSRKKNPLPADVLHIDEQPLSNVIVEMTTGRKIIRNGSN